MTDPITLSVAEGRRYQERSLAKRRAVLEEEEAHLAELQARDAPPAVVKEKAKCWICSEPVESGRNMGMTGLITGATVMVHARTGQAGGCWSIMQRARQTILPKCKVGPKLHNKPRGDILLRAEIDRMLTLPKFQAEVADQWSPSYSLTAKTGIAVRMDKIEQEFKVLKRAQLNSSEPEQGWKKATLDALRERATHNVDEREAALYSDPDIEFDEGPADHPENYEGEHGEEVD